MKFVILTFAKYAIYAYPSKKIFEDLGQSQRLGYLFDDLSNQPWLLLQ
jgi:hypothetical protein